LAVFLERPILYEMSGGTRTYAVDDDVQRYVFVHADDARADSEGSGPPDDGPLGRHQMPEDGTNRFVGASGRGGHHARSARTVIARAAGGVVVVAIAASLVVSFTASNTVPASRVGSSIQNRLISQLAPAGCASLSLTALVHGSGAFTNSVSNVLLLGSSGSDTITDTGAGNCIVSGGGSDSITGTATDICISGPTLNVAAPCPTSNGVSVAPTTQTFNNNSGGQEDLILTNKTSITAMTIVIKVAQTTGVSYSSQTNSYPGGAITESSSTSGGIITYTFVLAAGQVIAAAYPNGEVYAQYSDTGTAHDQGGDTWSVTSTSNGKTSTLTGAF
jgi:hypothetical protein